jgi:nucleotidyltransferase-like protein
MHIYAFGSVCRGDVTKGSDADLLAIVNGHDSRFDPETFSIYSYERIKELWRQGNPFAWHLALESRLLYSSDQHDFLKGLGNPVKYKECVRDCEKFFALFREASASILSGSNSVVFDLSTIFLSIRNFATCFSLGIGQSPDFFQKLRATFRSQSRSHLPKLLSHTGKKSNFMHTWLGSRREPGRSGFSS